MKYILTLSFVIAAIAVSAQNLVLNPSFETVTVGNLRCSWYTSNTQFIAAVSNWTYPTNGSTDIFHTSLATSCYSSPYSTHTSSNGSQAPRTGNAMVAVVTYGSGGCTPYREYVQGQLSSALTPGVTYDIQFYVSLGDNMTRATNNIGVKFTTTQQSTGSMCVWSASPEVNYSGAPITDKIGWTLMSYTFTPAVAGLDYFSIGNFFTDAATTTQVVSGTKSTIRYYLDDVSIAQICPPVSATWTNPSTLCAAAGNISLDPLITGTTGGTWSGTGVTGNTFNPSSGTQSVTYTVGSVGCEQLSTQTITVLPDVNPAWTNPSTICTAAGSINLDALITGTTGGTWSGTGVTGNTFNPSSGTQSVTYSVGSGGCVETSIQTITVLPDVNPAWTNPSTICAAAGSINLDALITGTTGGTWAGTGVTGNTFNPSSGTQSVTYTVGTTPCTETSVQTITVLTDVNPSWTNPSTICASAGSINLDALITGTTGGTWSGTGVTGSNFDPSSGTQSVTYAVGTTPCAESSVQTITVIPDVNPSWTNPSTICAAAGTINLDALITGTTGGTWSGTGVTGNLFDPSFGTQSVTYTVGTTPCIESSALTITVLSDVDPSWTNPGTVCTASGTINLDALITGTTGGTWSGTGVTGNLFDPSFGTQSVTYTVGSAPCAESSVQTITAVPVVNPSWTNPSTICAAAGTINLDALITGTTGGTWSGTGVTGSNFDPSFGTQSVTYTVGTTPCADSSALTITVIPDVDPSWTNPGTICTASGTINLDALITGTTGGTWSGTGVTGNLFDPISGTQSVTYTVGTTPCIESSVQTITVVSTVNPSWTNPSTICASAGAINLDSLITGTTGGAWSGTGVTGNLFDPSSGTQLVTYTVGTTPCADSSSLTITVIPDVDPTWTNPGPLCEASSNINLDTLITGTTGGTWSGTGVSGNLFDPSGIITSTDITYTTGTAPCLESFMLTILIDAEDDASFNYASGNTFCISGTNPLATIVGTAGGTFSISPAGTIDTVSGEINLPATGVGTFTVSYTTTPLGNPCPQSSSVSITIITSPNATFNYDATQYCHEATNPIISFPVGSTGGVFSAIPGGLSINSVTGAIDLLSSTPNTYTIYNNIAAAAGCLAAIDSIQITIHPNYTIALSTAICNGDSLFVGGAFQFIAGTYYDTLSTSYGCDSIISTSLSVLPIITTSLAASICVGDSLFVGGGFQFTSGVYNDTTTSALGCDSIVSTTLTVIPLNTVVVNSSSICLGDSSSLTAVGTGTGTITWYADANGTIILEIGTPFTPIITSAGTYIYYVNEVGACPGEMDSVILIVVDEVTASITASPIVGTMPLNVLFGNESTSGTGISYHWDFDDGDTSNLFEPGHVYQNEGVYDVVLTVTNGLCTDIATITIAVDAESDLIIPNVFTPNNDEFNDVFTVISSNLISIDAQIYNRWGELIYLWNYINGYWDGRTISGSLANDGTYFYLINAEGADGQKYSKQGTLTLIR